MFIKMSRLADRTILTRIWLLQRYDPIVATFAITNEETVESTSVFARHQYV